MRAIWAMAAAPVLLGATTPDGGYREEMVAGWKLEALDVEQDLENPSPPYLYEMALATPQLRIDYEIKAGQERELSVQRLNCGTATDASGGVNFVDSVYLSGDRARDMTAIGELARNLDASFDDYCKAPASRLVEAMKNFAAAAERLESWAAARPIPPHWAWQLDYLYEPLGRSILRRNHAFSVRYDLPGDSAEPGGLTVDVVDCPSGENFIDPFFASIERSAPAEAHHRRVRAALDKGVATLAPRCGLDAAAGRELGEGLEEAIVRGESEARKDVGGA